MVLFGFVERVFMVSLFFAIVCVVVLSSAESQNPSSSSLFQLPQVSEGFPDESLKQDVSGSPNTTKYGEGAARPLTGITAMSISELQQGETLLRHYLKVDEEVAKPSLVGLPREQLHFLSCGAPGFGNDIPQDFSEFVRRTGEASISFRNKRADISEGSFDWSVPVVEGKSYVPKVIKWSNLASEMGVSIEDPAQDNKNIFHSADLRYIMPKMKLAVKEDTLSNIFDVFLFAPEVDGRPSGHSTFRMGVPSGDIDAHLDNVLIEAKAAEQAAADLIAEAVRRKEQELMSRPESGLQPVVGLDGDKPFIAMLPADSRNAMAKAEQDALVTFLEETEKERVEAEKRREVLGSAVSGMTGTIVGSDAVSSLTGSKGSAQQMQRGITKVVDSLTGREPTQAESVTNVAQSVARMASGDISVSEIGTLVSNAAKAVGKTPFRLLMEKAVEGRMRERRLEIVPNGLAQATAAGSKLDRKRPFLFGELRVKNSQGETIFGPMTVYCPYFALPKSELKTAGDDDVLLFEITLRTQSGEFIVDEFGRPLIAKQIFARGDTLDTNTDDKSKCPQLVQGLRILDIDFEDFDGASVHVKEFVRTAVANALNVKNTDINFCDSKVGSVITAFDAGSDVAMEWDAVVGDKNAAIHRILQIDADFPTLVDKDDLYGENEMELGDAEDVDGVIPYDAPEDGDYELVNLTDYDDIPRKDDLVPLPEDVLVRARTGEGESEEDYEEESGGLPGWAVALIIIIVLIVVAVAIGGAILYVFNKRKLKKDEEVVGRPVEDLDYPPGTEHAGVHSGGMKKQASGIVVPADAKSSAINRDARRQTDSTTTC